MTRTLLSFVVGICGISVTAAAQSTLPIAVDQRVRLTIGSDSVRVGRVVSVGDTNFRMSINDQETITVDRIGLTKIEVSRGQKSKWKKYALNGAIILGAIGAVSGGLQHEQVGEDGASVGEAAALGLWSGGLFGGLIGGAIGATQHTDRWEQVWP